MATILSTEPCAFVYDADAGQVMSKRAKVTWWIGWLVAFDAVIHTLSG